MCAATAREVGGDDTQPAYNTLLLACCTSAKDATNQLRQLVSATAKLVDLPHFHRCHAEAQESRRGEDEDKCEIVDPMLDQCISIVMVDIRCTINWHHRCRRICSWGHWGHCGRRCSHRGCCWSCCLCCRSHCGDRWSHCRRCLSHDRLHWSHCGCRWSHCRHRWSNCGRCWSHLGHCCRHCRGCLSHCRRDCSHWGGQGSRHWSRHWGHNRQLVIAIEELRQ